MPHSAGWTDLRPYDRGQCRRLVLRHPHAPSAQAQAQVFLDPVAGGGAHAQQGLQHKTGEGAVLINYLPPKHFLPDFFSSHTLEVKRVLGYVPHNQLNY